MYRKTDRMFLYSLSLLFEKLSFWPNFEKKNCHFLPLKKIINFGQNLKDHHFYVQYMTRPFFFETDPRES